MITYLKTSQFYCDPCKKMIRGAGYLVNRKVYCEKHYAEAFPKFNKEEAEKNLKANGLEFEDIEDIR